MTRPGAQALASGYAFDAHRRILDPGGGTGSYLLTLLKSHPHLSGTLFELPGDPLGYLSAHGWGGAGV